MRAWVLSTNMADKAALHRPAAPPLPTTSHDHDKAVDRISVVANAAVACQTAGAL